MSRRFTVLLLLGMVLLAACEARLDSTLVVREDESGAFTIEMSLDDELRQLLEEQGGEQFLGFADQLQDVPDGWSSEAFREGEFEGVRVTTTFEDFEQLRTRMVAIDAELGRSELALPATFQTLGLAREGDQFTFRADLGDAAGGLDAFSDQQVGGLDVAQIIDTIFTIRFIVTLPGEVVDHNADSLNESTLVWELTSTDATSVLRAVSSVDSGLPVGSALGVAAVATVLVALALFLVARSRRRRAEELEATRLVDAAGG